MTNTTPQPTSYYAQPPVAAPSSIGSAPNSNNQKPAENGIEHMKKSTKYLFAGVLMFVLMLGGGAAMYLMSVNSDPRQQASTSELPDQISEPTLPPMEPQGEEPEKLPESSAQPLAACSTAAVDNRRTEWVEDYSKIAINWTLTSGTPSEYEIWNISYEPLNEQKPENYYLVNLTQGQTLAGSATSYIVDKPNDLQTRRFLIRAIQSRNEQGLPQCYDQWALCQPPVITDRKVVQTAENTYQFTWTPVQKPHERYEIWMIGVGTLEELGEKNYYLKLLAKEVDPNATSHTVVLDAEAQAINTNRFLIRYINYTEDDKPQCYDQGALSVGDTTPPSEPPVQVDACTMKFTIAVPVGATATPTITPTSPPGATATPTVTPTSAPAVTPVIGCDQLCVTNADCTNSAHICWTVSETESRCRLDSNPDDNQCRPPSTGGQQTVQPTAEQQQPVLPESLPETGPENWGNWLKAGLAILGIGAALLLML